MRTGGSNPPMEDELTTFFKNMEQTTRKFGPQLQVKVKRMISDIIYDAEDTWLGEQND